ncbi:MAG: hypothetical protein L3K52_03945 [Candidatus Thiothrix sulfatifontis]|nr:MAG: hypothetical protein L3K52_03945 [Candidatus Thiothrix sulfatifontis]
MPSHPRIDKGEGLIRTYDLLQELRADIDAAYEILETDRQSQYLRRCVVRAVFSYVEALIECIKVELRSTIRTRKYSNPLSAKERETLGSLTIVGTSHRKFLSLEQNVQRTFKLAAKIWNIDFQLSTQDNEFNEFLTAKWARNRLTHPKSFYDIQVTDFDMHCHTRTGMWLQEEFQRLFQARVSSLRKYSNSASSSPGS